MHDSVAWSWDLLGEDRFDEALAAFEEMADSTGVWMTKALRGHLVLARATREGRRPDDDVGDVLSEVEGALSDMSLRMRRRAVRVALATVRAALGRQ